ncbi:hypothetical protein NCC49_005171 [Naganishia albida]|nr:hypothetical protein NCC49_005171 [Naganishia albida]
MVALAHLLTTFTCLSSLSVTLATYIPPQKRAPNGTCCGYYVENRDGFFRNRHEINFDQLASMDAVFTAGWEVSHGWQAGGINELTGQIPMADEKNVDLVRGQGLRLRVPRQDKNAKTISVAEITFPDVLLGGVIEITAKLTNIAGTCMGMFTTHADPWDRPLGWKDEQDVEILGGNLFQGNEFQPSGIQMYNWDPKSGAKAQGLEPFPTGIDPSATFNTYSIAWFPTTSDSNPARLTEYRFNNCLINGPRQFSSTNPSSLLINHWSNGDGRWSGGPPSQDVYMIIKRVVVYYDKPAKIASGTGVLKTTTCSRATACRVTV